MVHVLVVTVVPPYSLHLRFDDGAEGYIDMTDPLWGELGTPLKDPEEFAKVFVEEEFGNIAWPTGMDCCPDWCRMKIR